MDLETRIKRLERQNQILKYGGLLVVAVVLFSAFVPQDQVRDVIQAHRFELRDTDGRLAAVLRLGDGSQSDNPFTRQSRAGAALEIFGSSGLPVVTLTGGRDGGSLLMRTRLSGIAEGNTYVRLEGPNGSAVLGNTTTVSERTGAETTFPVSTLTLFDGEGNVRHRVPR